MFRLCRFSDEHSNNNRRPHASCMSFGVGVLLFFPYAKSAASPSILYALVGHLRREQPTIMRGIGTMLSFVTSQAVALSQIKRGQGKSRDSVSVSGFAGRGSDNRKSLFARAFDALVVSRLRKAKFEIQAHRRMYGDRTNK
jgi:hypothetical protein